MSNKDSRCDICGNVLELAETEFGRCHDCDDNGYECYSDLKLDADIENAGYPIRWQDWKAGVRPKWW